MNPIKKVYRWYYRPNKGWLAENVEGLAVVLVIAFIIRTFGFGLYQVPTGSMETTLLVGERFFADKFTINFVPPKHGDIISFNDPLYPYSSNPVKYLFQKYVWGPQNWTKRVIGIPGDHLVGMIQDGTPVVYRNDTKLEEPYLNKYPLVPAGMNEWRSYDPSKPFDQQPFYDMNEQKVRANQRIYQMYGYPGIKQPGTPLGDPREGRDEFDVKLGDNEYWVMGDNRLGSADSRSWGKLDGSLIHGKIKFRILSVDSTNSWLLLDILFHPIEFWSRVRWNRMLQWVS